MTTEITQTLLDPCFITHDATATAATETMLLEAGSQARWMMPGLARLTWRLTSIAMQEFVHHAHYYIPAVAVGSLCVILWKSREVIATEILDATGQQPPLNPTIVRTIFINADEGHHRLVPLHTHAMSAAARTAADEMFVRIAQTLNMPLHTDALPNGNQRRGRMGTRLYHLWRDLYARPQYDTPQGVRCMVDGDYYRDMHDYLNQHFNVVLLYTLIPDHAGHNSDDYSYWFNHDSSIQMRVGGGATYSHPLWDWNPDHVVATDWLGNTTSYHVHRKMIAADRQAVCLIPERRFPWYTAWFARWWLRPQYLQRFDPVDNGFVRIYKQTDKGLFVSTGKVGTTYCVDVPEQQDAAIASTRAVSKVEITTAHVVAITQDRNGGPLLTEYHKLGLKKKAFVFPVAKSVSHYQRAAPKDYDPHAKETMVPFMSPFIVGLAYAPMSTLANDTATINGRVIKVRSDIQASQQTIAAIQAFLSCLPIEPHTLHPAEFSDVWDKQNRPAQRHLYQVGVNIGPLPQVAAAHQKAETYVDLKDPRNITVGKPDVKISYSRFMYALATGFKNLHWYAFGSTPCEVANRVAEICLHALECVMNADASRFDGHVSPACRLAEIMLLQYLFHPDYHTEILELWQKQQYLEARTTHGVTYNTGTSRASGSPETSVLNTYLNAFMAFAALLESGLTPNQAYKRLGIYGGDDGLTADIDADVYKRSGTYLGQVLECEPIRRGALGVKFLARLYGPTVWEGNPNSMCDIRRQLAKFHVTTRLAANVTPAMKLVEKCMSFALSDPATPVIGPFVLRCLELAKPEHKAPMLLGIGQYHNRFDQTPDVQYPNEYDDWMVAVMLEQLPELALDTYAQWLQHCICIDDLLAVPLLADYTRVHDDAIINGEITPAPAPAPAEQTRPARHRNKGPNARERRMQRRAANRTVQ